VHVFVNIPISHYIYRFYDGKNKEGINEYQRYFPNCQIPVRQVFSDIRQRFWELGTVLPHNQEHVALQPTAVDQCILGLVQHNLMTCVQRLSNWLAKFISSMWWNCIVATVNHIRWRSVARARSSTRWLQSLCSILRPNVCTLLDSSHTVLWWLQNSGGTELTIYEIPTCVHW
jgi:hypothetical protein